MSSDPECPQPTDWPMPAAFETWTHAGLQCVLTPTPDITVPKGPHNGYVRVPPGHPAAGKSYDAAEALFDLDVNGGLTYAYQCPDGGTWFGWDDMHLWRSPSPSACLHEALTLLGLESEDA